MAFNPIFHTDEWKGKTYTLTFRQWSELTEITKNCIIYRWNQWKRNKLDKKYILWEGQLPPEASCRVNRAKTKPIGEILTRWILRPERYMTANLKFLYLDYE